MADSQYISKKQMVSIQDETERTKTVTTQSGRAYSVPIEVAYDLERSRAALAFAMEAVEFGTFAGERMSSAEVMAKLKQLCGLPSGGNEEE